MAGIIVNLFLCLALKHGSVQYCTSACRQNIIWECSVGRKSSLLKIKTCFTGDKHAPRAKA